MKRMFKSHTPFEARFKRYECKYLITEEQAEDLRNYIHPYVDVDIYGKNSPDRSYDIKSLYLDAPDLKLYRETRNGVKDRIKLRIRTYSTSERQPVFLEIKRRCNALVLKGRARISRPDMETVLRGCAPDISGMAGDERACYDEFLGWMSRWLARPVVWVGYRREAYVGSMNPGVRITMDRRLVYALSALHSACLEGAAWRPIIERRIVLELKFNVAFPEWMQGLVQRLGLKRLSFSKYGNAVHRNIEARSQSLPGYPAFPAFTGNYANERNRGEFA